MAAVAQRTECMQYMDSARCLRDFSKEQQAAEDRELASLARMGDTRAFAELYKRYYDGLLGKAIQITGNLEDAEDVLQTAQMSALIHIQSFNGRSLYRTWITRIVINTAITHLRKKKLHREIAIDAGWNEGEPSNDIQIPDQHPGPMEQYEESRLAERLRHSFRSLKPKQRRVLDLYMYKELSLQEIADRLKIHVSTVKSRIFHARMQLCRHCRKDNPACLNKMW